MGFAGDERGAHQCFCLVLVWSLLILSPLAAAYEERFCAEYVQDACSELSHEEFEAVGSICKCFVKGPDACCNLDGEDGTLAPDMLGRFKSVFVSNASSVTYTQLCGTQQKVTFDKVNDGILVSEKKFAGMDCLIDFKAVDSSVENILHCRRVQLYTSSVKRIADSAVLVNLVLDRSQAETIENFTMTQSAADPTECLAFDDSRVSIMRNIVAMCDAHVDKSKIKQISGTSLFRSRISSTEVEEVLTDGLTLQHGWHKMVNVTIQNLRKNALIFGPFSEVNLYNLQINQCEMPCIISRTKYVNFKNLIINGNKIEDFLDTPYIDVEKHADRTLIGSNSTLCQQIGKSLECQSDRVSAYKVLEFLPDFSFPETKLSKFSFMGVSSHCFKLLKLEEVNGWVRNLRPEDPSFKDLCVYKNQQIVIKDCQRIDYIQSDYLDQLVADDSDIQFLDISSRLSKVYLSNVKIHVLENMEYAARPGARSSFNLKSVQISSLYNLLLKSPGLMTDFSVLGRVSNFTVDTFPGGITTIRGGVIRTVPAQGITIRSGVLALENVKILEMGYGAINIEDSGRLLIIPSADLLEPFVCDKGPRIVARRSSQVAFLYPMPTPRWLRQCTVSEGAYSDVQKDHKLRFTNFVTEDYCNFDQEDHATCNMSNAQGPTLLGGSNALKNAVGVTVSGSANLTVGDNCFDIIKLEGVIGADFIDMKNSCYYKLILTDKTSVLNVVNNLYDLKVYQSSIGKLAPSATLVSVEARNSTIRRLSVTIKKGLFKNVTIKDISVLKIINEVEFINCNLTKLYKGSVEVERGAILRFTNCSINMMSAKSFNVRGSVLFTNVTINLAENETISIDRDAFLTMEGVSFRKEVVNPFAIDSSPHILLNDVKMNKIQVKLDKRFDVSVSYMNGTIVGQGHLESATEARMKIVWFCLTGMEILSLLLLTAACLVCFVAYYVHKKKAEKLRDEKKQQAQSQQSQEGQTQEGQNDESHEEQAPAAPAQSSGPLAQPSGPLAQLAKEALQAVKGPHQQGQTAPEEVPLTEVGSAESVSTSTATTSTDDSAKSVSVEETVLITIDKGSMEDAGLGARGGEHGPGHENAAITSASVQPRKGGPKKPPSNASDDPESARDDDNPGDEQPLL